MQKSHGISCSYFTFVSTTNYFVIQTPSSFSKSQRPHVIISFFIVLLVKQVYVTITISLA